MEVRDLCGQGLVLKSVPGHDFSESSVEFFSAGLVIGCFVLNLFEKLLQCLSCIRGELLSRLLM